MFTSNADVTDEMREADASGEAANLHIAVVPGKECPIVTCGSMGFCTDTMRQLGFDRSGYLLLPASYRLVRRFKKSGNVGFRMHDGIAVK